MATLSFSLVDSPSPYVWPYPEVAQNAGGLAGAWVAYHLFSYFGLGSYAVVGGLTLVLIVLAWKGEITLFWQRVLGVALLITVVSSAAHLFTGAEMARWLELRGGVLGYTVGGWLQESFKWMTTPILVYGLIVGLLFTAEELVMSAPAVLRTRGRIFSEATSNRKSSKVKKTSTSTAISTFFSRISQSCTAALAVLKTLKPTSTDKPHKQKLAAPSTTAVVEPEEIDEEEEVLENEEPAEVDDEIEEEEEYDEVEDEDEDEEPEDWDEDEDEDEDEEEEVEDDDEEVDEEEELLTPEPLVNVAAPPKPGANTAVNPIKPYPAELDEWEFPSLELLHEPEYSFNAQQESIVREKAKLLEQALQEYRIEAKVVEIDTGPVITMFELQVAPGVKVSQINSLANDIARSLRAPSVRVVAPIPGKTTIGIEVPNTDKEKVRLKELMTVAGPQAHKMALPLFLGKDASGGMLVGDLAKMPHMLIAGTTGSGKSVCINSIIISLLMTQRPDIVKLILVDPKMVEMSMFRDVPHLMSPIVTEMERAEKILEWATTKMDERYALLAEAGVRNIAAYNRLSKEEKYERFQPTTDEEKAQIPLHIPYMVIVIDELADLMMLSAKEVEMHLSRLAQKSRAVGIHIIVATQRPEAKVVTGLIKSNLPCRIAFRVASRMDSRIVLDQNGAEVLMGQGDMLYLPAGSSKLVRAQGTFLEDNELKDIIGFLKERAEPEFHPELMRVGKQELTGDGPRDELFDQAVEVVLETKRGSVSLLQRRLTIGYARASRLIEEMAAMGIVGPYKGSQAREVAITRDEWEEIKQQETAQIRTTALQGDDVPDMMFDDDL